MNRADYRKLVETIVGRVAVHLGADGRMGRLVAVFTGASADFSQAVDQVRGLIIDGFRIETIFSEAAEALYGPSFREKLGGFPHLTAVDETRWITAADDAVAVVVPMLSLNTLSQVTLLTAGSRPANIILRALFTGRPVVAAHNGARPDAHHWQALAGRAQPPALKAAVTDRLKTFAAYGGLAVDVGDLRRRVAALHMEKPARKVSAETHGVTLSRKALRLTSAVVTATQVQMARAQQADLILPSGAKVTPLARELAHRHGIALHLTDNQAIVVAKEK